MAEYWQKDSVFYDDVIYDKAYKNKKFMFGKSNFNFGVGYDFATKKSLIYNLKKEWNFRPISGRK